MTVSRSPPNAWPVLTVPASQPAARSPAADRENQAGPRAAAYVMLDGGARARLAQPGEDGRQGRVQVRHDDRHPAQVVRIAEHLVVR